MTWSRRPRWTHSETCHHLCLVILRAGVQDARLPAILSQHAAIFLKPPPLLVAGHSDGCLYLLDALVGTCINTIEIHGFPGQPAFNAVVCDPATDGIVVATPSVLSRITFLGE